MAYQQPAKQEDNEERSEMGLKKNLSTQNTKRNKNIL